MNTPEDLPDLLTPGEVAQLFCDTFSISERSYYKASYPHVEFRYYGAIPRKGTLRAAIKRARREDVLAVIDYFLHEGSRRAKR